LAVAATSPDPNLKPPPTKPATATADTTPSPEPNRHLIAAAVVACAQIKPPQVNLDTEAFDAALGLIRQPKRQPVTPDRQQEVVTRHAGGEGVLQLAKVFGLHRSTVNRILRDAGVQPPSRSLGGKVDDIRRFYEAGASIEATGRHFGVSHGTMQRFMREQGIRARGRREWRSLAA
jgi:transposase-like protein